ncbi:MAG: DUF3084 domain-containing protein [Synechococcales bacterium]|nr:DUF3084 domain-containing protein [Synechococcales bacterium]
MSSGYILILAVLVLGGVIATLGDRIGTRVGKARLSLFKMRPKRTAVFVTILTGILISASTLGIMLAASKEFRDMLFRFGVIRRQLGNSQKALDQARSDMNALNQQKQEVESQLNQSRQERTDVQTALDRLKESLADSQERQRAIEDQRDRVRSQLSRVSEQAGVLKREIAELQTEKDNLAAERDAQLAQRDAQLAQRDRQITSRQQEIAKRNRMIQQRDREISERDKILGSRETRLKELEQEQLRLLREFEVLNQEIVALTDDAQRLRVGRPAILRNQVLAAGVVRIEDPRATRQAIDQILRQANRTATLAINPGLSPNAPEGEQIIQITQSDVENLAKQISNGEEYYIRVLATFNYFLGEKIGDKTGIAVFSDVVRNRVIFSPGDVLATTSLNPMQMPSAEIQARINQLLAASGFRARREGVLTDNVQVSRVQSYIRFLDQLREVEGTVEIRAIAGEKTYPSSPMRLEFMAIQNGQTILQTN